MRPLSLAAGLLCAFAVAMTVPPHAQAQAQSYPTGPVKIIIGVGPGASPDVIGRVVADHLARLWGQQVVVLNQPGDRKSTRLNSSHSQISYAVFCLKKKI